MKLNKIIALTLGIFLALTFVLIIIIDVYADVIVIESNASISKDKDCGGNSDICYDNTLLCVGNTGSCPDGYLSSYLFFNFTDIAGLTSTNLIEANISLRGNDAGTHYFNVTRITADWSESDNTKPTINTNIVYESLRYEGTSTWWNFSFTNIVNESLNGSIVNYGYRFNATIGAGGSGYFDSSESPSGVARWYMTITYNPPVTTTTSTTTSTTSTTLGLGINLDLYINASKTNKTVVQNERVNITGYLGQATEFFQLYINTLLIQNSTSPIINLTVYWTTAGSKNITLFYGGNTTYANNRSQLWVDVNDVITPIVYLISPVDNSFYNRNKISVNYTIEELDLNDTFYTIDKGKTNTTITQNITVTFPFGSYILSLFARDNSSRIGSDSSSVFHVMGIGSENYTLVGSQETLNHTLEFSQVNFTINITKAGASPSLSLVFNNTAYNPDYSTTIGNVTYYSKILALPRNPDTHLNWSYQFFWNISWDSTIWDNSSYFNITTWQRRISNGTDSYSTVKTLNFTVRDEQTNLTVNISSIKAEFFTYATTSGQRRQFNFEFGNTTNTSVFSYTIYPSWTNYTLADAEIIYNANGYSERRWIQRGLQLSNYTQHFVLYTLQSGETSQVIIHLNDPNDNELAGYEIEAWMYNTGTGTYTLADSDTTGADGKVIFNLDTNNKEYRFKVYYQGTFKKQEDIKLYANQATYEFFIVLSIGATETTQTYYDLQQLPRWLWYDITTGNVSYVWDDSVNDITDEFCLKINQKSQYNDTEFYNQCSSSTNSSLVYHLGNYTSNYTTRGLFIAVGSAKATFDKKKYNLNILEINTKTPSKPFGRESYFVAMIIIGTLALIGIAFGSPSASFFLTGIGLMIVEIIGFTGFGWLAAGGIVALLWVTAYLVRS